MVKVSLILIINLLNLINSDKTIDQQKFALILSANYSKFRQQINSYCIYFEVIKNFKCLSLTKKNVYVLCEKPAINKFGNCNGEGFYGLNSYFLNIKNNCLGIWKKLNKTLNCKPDFIFV